MLVRVSYERVVDGTLIERSKRWEFLGGNVGLADEQRGLYQCLVLDDVWYAEWEVYKLAATPDELAEFPVWN
uniref:Uncharacterized protein n=1 Tax=Setaria digitata TaxID=48799 RepID=A0A915PJU1_9BILA